jgi:hypothetical protein
MTDRLDEAGMPMLAQPCAALTTANAERETLEAIHEFLGIASKRLYPTPDKPNSDWAKLRSAVDALALLEARAALTAGKVAEQEPTGFKTVPVKVTDAMIDAANAVPSGLAGSPPHWQWVWDALLSAAPQQTAQSTEPKTAREAVIEECVKECYVVLNAARCARSRHAAALCVVAVCALLTPPRKTTC